MIIAQHTLKRGVRQDVRPRHRKCQHNTLREKALGGTENGIDGLSLFNGLCNGIIRRKPCSSDESRNSKVEEGVKVTITFSRPPPKVMVFENEYSTK